MFSEFSIIMDRKLNELKQQVSQLLLEYPDGIKVNSFWGYYERKYRNLPDPKSFRVRRRSEILDLCSDVYRKVGFGGAGVILPRSSNEPRGSIHEQTENSDRPQQSTQPTASSESMTSSFAAQATGSFYNRFYASQSDSDPEFDGPQSSRSVSAISQTTRTGAPSVLPSSAASSQHPPQPGSFFRPPNPVPRTPFASSSASAQHGFSTPGYRPASSPGSRDSSSSRSSDGTRNETSARAVRPIGPPHRPPTSSTSTPSLSAGRMSAAVPTPLGQPSIVLFLLQRVLS